MSNFGDFVTRNTVEDTDLVAGHRGTTTVSGVKPESKWTWLTLRTALASLFAPLSHVSNTSNPHSVTKTQVGLSNVTNDAQLKAADLDIDGTMAANSDSLVPSQQAVREYVASNAGSGTSTRKTITQAAHGFSAKQAVYDSGGTWTLSNAAAIGTTRVGGVIESVTTNTFVVVFGGELAVTGWAANTQYFLSDATPGLLVPAGSEPTAPTSYVVPVARTGAATTAIVEIGDPLPLVLIPNSALATDAARPAQVSSPERTAGSETALRSYSPADIAAMAGVHGGGSGGSAHVMSGGIAATDFTHLETIPGGAAATDFATSSAVHGSNASVTF